MYAQSFLFFNYLFVLVLSHINDNVCYLLASTNIASISIYSMWECVNYIPVNGGPCNKTAGRWEGVICLGVDLDIVTQIYIMELRIYGTIPSELGRITTLNALTLPSNSFYGSLPNELCNLRMMSNLDLSRNSFSKSLPSCIGNFNTIYSLQLSYNKFTGSIPTGIGNMTSLYALVLNNNAFQYSIPTEISKLTRLFDVVMNDNQLSGILSLLLVLYSCIYIYIYIYM